MTPPSPSWPSAPCSLWPSGSLGATAAATTPSWTDASSSGTGMADDDWAKNLVEFAQGLMRLGELTKTILDATDGHRAACIERGYSPTAAEVMAMEVHNGMTRMVFGGIAAAQGTSDA